MTPWLQLLMLKINWSGLIVFLEELIVTIIVSYDIIIKLSFEFFSSLLFLNRVLECVERYSNRANRPSSMFLIVVKIATLIAVKIATLIRSTCLPYCWISLGLSELRGLRSVRTAIIASIRLNENRVSKVPTIFASLDS